MCIVIHKMLFFTWIPILFFYVSCCNAFGVSFNTPPPACYCPPGFHCYQTYYTICDSGTYSHGNSWSCTPCAPGTYIEYQEATDCKPAIQGYYVPNSGSTYQTSCGVGYICSGKGNAARKACGAGTYQPNESSSYCNDNDSSCYGCWSCDAGSYQPNSAQGSCIKCPGGSYSELSGQSSCDSNIPCPKNWYCQSGSRSKTSCPDSDERYCPSGSIFPIVCPNGKMTLYNSSVSIDDCVACEEGSYCINGFQYDCPLGSYCPKGSSLPTPCPNGFLTASNSSLSILNCTIECEEGNYCIKGYPYDCPLGSYCPKGSSLPTLCPNGSFSQNSNSFLVSDCLPCPSNSYCIGGKSLFCNSASVFNQSYSCCDYGSYISGIYLKNYGSVTCTDCPIGTYSLTLNSTECIDCPQGFACGVSSHYFPVICEPGTYSLNNSASCTSCENGLISSSEGSFGCVPCAAGKIYFNTSYCSDRLESRISKDAMALCTTFHRNDCQNCGCCGEGLYQSLGSCKICPSKSEVLIILGTILLVCIGLLFGVLLIIASLGFERVRYFSAPLGVSYSFLIAVFSLVSLSQPHITIVTSSPSASLPSPAPAVIYSSYWSSQLEQDIINANAALRFQMFDFNFVDPQCFQMIFLNLTSTSNFTLGNNGTNIMADASTFPYSMLNIFYNYGVAEMKVTVVSCLPLLFLMVVPFVALAEKKLLQLSKHKCFKAKEKKEVKERNDNNNTQDNGVEMSVINPLNIVKSDGEEENFEIITVTGGGSEDVNGEYKPIGFKNDAPLFKNKRDFLLSREVLNGKETGWIIGKFPSALYGSPCEEKMPPKERWIRYKGKDPPPKLTWVTRKSSRKITTTNKDKDKNEDNEQTSLSIIKKNEEEEHVDNVFSESMNLLSLSMVFLYPQFFGNVTAFYNTMPSGNSTVCALDETLNVGYPNPRQSYVKVWIVADIFFLALFPLYLCHLLNKYDDFTYISKKYSDGNAVFEVFVLFKNNLFGWLKSITYKLQWLYVFQILGIFSLVCLSILIQLRFLPFREKKINVLSLILDFELIFQCFISLIFFAVNGVSYIVASLFFYGAISFGLFLTIYYSLIVKDFGTRKFENEILALIVINIRGEDGSKKARIISWGTIWSLTLLSCFASLIISLRYIFYYK